RGCAAVNQVGTAAAPLFHIAFQSASAPGDHGAGSDCADELAQCDIVIRARDENGSATVDWDYDSELFDPPTIERFLRHFDILLAGMTADPRSSLAALPLLAPA